MQKSLNLTSVTYVNYRHEILEALLEYLYLGKAKVKTLTKKIGSMTIWQVYNLTSPLN